MTTPESLPRRKLGNTGIEVTELGLGTWGLAAESYGAMLADQRERTIKRALEQGLCLFDMAPTWGAEGTSERAVAEAVGTRRDEVVYVTRVGQVPSDMGVEPRFDAVSLRAQCEGSLKRLATDRIDVLLLHEPKEHDLRSAQVRDTMEALVHEKKVRAWGASVSELHVARAAIECSSQVLCLPFHALRPDLLWDLSADVRARGIGVLARSILNHGMLAGRWSARKRFLPDDHRTHRWSSDALARRVQQATDLRFLVHGPVLSLAAAAERFVLAHDVVSAALIGPRTPGQVEASVHALAGRPYMSEEDLAKVKKLAHA